MTISRFFLLAFSVIGLAISATPASATVVDYSGNFVDMTPTPLEIGQSGTITSTSPGFGSTVFSLITGSLPANSMVTFSYNFSGTILSGLLNASGGYSYIDGGVAHAGYTTASAPGGFGFSASFEDGTPVAPLALSSAQIDSTSTATVVIKNLSAGALSYASSLMASVFGSKNFTVAYNVSAVPVPAALPLFGLGLGAIAAMRARRKNKEELAA